MKRFAIALLCALAALSQNVLANSCGLSFAGPGLVGPQPPSTWINAIEGNGSSLRVYYFNSSAAFSPAIVQSKVISLSPGTSVTGSWGSPTLRNRLDTWSGGNGGGPVSLSGISPIGSTISGSLVFSGMRTPAGGFHMFAINAIEVYVPQPDILVLSGYPFQGTANGYSVSPETFLCPAISTMASARALVSTYYSTALGRPATQSETDSVLAQVDYMHDSYEIHPARVLEATAYNLFRSAAYAARNRTDDQFIADLHRALWGVNPSQETIDGWRDYVLLQGTRSTLLVQFVTDPQFDVNVNSSIGGLPASRPEVDVVFDAYIGALKRAPTDAEYVNAVGPMRTAQCSGRASVIAAIRSLTESLFTGSAYASMATSNSQYVVDAEYAILGGDGLPGNYRWYVEMLDRGAHDPGSFSLTRSQVRSYLLDPNREYAVESHADNIVAAGCVPH